MVLLSTYVLPLQDAVWARAMRLMVDKLTVGRSRARDSEPRVSEGCGKNGRGEWIRTTDPLHPMQVRYQAAPRPDPSQHTIEPPTAQLL